MNTVYLDYNASAPFPDELRAEMDSILHRGLANPSSPHALGRQSRRLINQATEAVARLLGCEAEFIYWTSGGSEANSWAIHSAVLLARSFGRKPRILVSAVEHESVHLAAGAAARDREAEILRIPVDGTGRMTPDALARLLAEAPCDLVSIQYANNETGVLQPIAEASALCGAARVPLHVDCVQAFGKIRLDLRGLGATYATFSGHKIGAPKGTGFLVADPGPLGEGRWLWPLIHGKQQKGLRGGTENPLGVALTGRIAQGLSRGEFGFSEGLAALHADFEVELTRRVPGAVIHGQGAFRMGNTTYVGFQGIDGDGVLLSLDLEGICASAGAACASGSLDPSPVLLAMGCDKAMARSSVRFSSGRGSSWKDFERVLNVLPGIVERVRSSGQ